MTSTFSNLFQEVKYELPLVVHQHFLLCKLFGVLCVQLLVLLPQCLYFAKITSGRHRVALNILFLDKLTLSFLVELAIKVAERVVMMQTRSIQLLL